MSSPEHTGHDAGEQRSSIRLTRNAKGDTQIDVKVRVGDTEADVAHARDLALRVYRELWAEFYGRTISGAPRSFTEPD
jgi:hypothetical protein